MIRFRHNGQDISLATGSTWCMPMEAAPYRDTPSEDLLAVIREVRAGRPWREAVQSRYKQSNPWLTRVVTSPLRDLFFRRHPVSPGCRVLDIGAGWGQIAVPLAQAGALVTALEPTPERLDFIYAAANQEGVIRNMTFLKADFFAPQFEPDFDLACCIGVLEWVAKFRLGDAHEVRVDFLRRIRALLAPGGRLVIGIENRLGLKYIIGAPDDHIGVSGISVYDQRLADSKWLARTGMPLRCHTFTRAELETLLAEAGFTTCAFYAAIPDYKLPECILPLGDAVDKHYIEAPFLPEHNGSNGTPLAFQAELASHYRSLAHLKVSSQFVPSFFVVCTF